MTGSIRSLEPFVSCERREAGICWPLFLPKSSVVLSTKRIIFVCASTNQTEVAMTENTPKTRSVGVIKTEKLSRLPVWKDYAKAAADAAAAKRAQDQN